MSEIHVSDDGVAQSVQVTAFPIPGYSQRSGQNQTFPTEVMHDHAALESKTKTGLFIAALRIEIRVRVSTIFDIIGQSSLVGDAATDMQTAGRRVPNSKTIGQKLR